jgi:hypothetical protein
MLPPSLDRSVAANNNSYHFVAVRKIYFGHFPTSSVRPTPLLFMIETDFLAITVRRANATPQKRVNLFAKKSRLRHCCGKYCQILNKNALSFRNGLGLSIAIE